MNTAGLLPALPFPPLPVAWRSLGRQEIRGAAAFGLVTFGFFVAVETPSELFHNPIDREMLVWVVGQAVKYQIWAFSLMLALVIADRAVDRGAARLPTYTLAIVSGCVAGTALWTLVAVLLSFNAFYPPLERLLHRLVWLLFYNLSMWVMVGASIGFLYAEVRRARQTRARLAAAELERVRESNAAVESRLAAMQARVEPQFLFDTLWRIEGLYATDAPRADQMLDDLITYLRAAMPRMRETSSTVGTEVDLARSYLAIIARREEAAPGWTIEAEDGLAEAHLPPMLLLPLIEIGLAPGVPDTPGEFLRITVARNGDTLRLAVAARTDAAPRGATDARVGALRDCLTSLYGARGRLVQRTLDVHRTETVVEIPFEPSHANPSDAGSPPRS